MFTLLQAIASSQIETVSLGSTAASVSLKHLPDFQHQYALVHLKLFSRENDSLLLDEASVVSLYAVLKRNRIFKCIPDLMTRALTRLTTPTPQNNPEDLETLIDATHQNLQWALSYYADPAFRHPLYSKEYLTGEVFKLFEAIYFYQIGPRAVCDEMLCDSFFNAFQCCLDTNLKFTIQFSPEQQHVFDAILIRVAGFVHGDAHLQITPATRIALLQCVLLKGFDVDPGVDFFSAGVVSSLQEIDFVLYLKQIEEFNTAMAALWTHFYSYYLNHLKKLLSQDQIIVIEAINALNHQLSLIDTITISNAQGAYQFTPKIYKYEPIQITKQEKERSASCTWSFWPRPKERAVTTISKERFQSAPQTHSSVKHELLIWNEIHLLVNSEKGSLKTKRIKLEIKDKSFIPGLSFSKEEEQLVHQLEEILCCNNLNESLLAENTVLYQRISSQFNSSPRTALDSRFTYIWELIENEGQNTLKFALGNSLFFKSGSLQFELNPGEISRPEDRMSPFVWRLDALPDFPVMSKLESSYRLSEAGERILPVLCTLTFRYLCLKALHKNAASLTKLFTENDLFLGFDKLLKQIEDSVNSLDKTNLPSSVFCP